MVHSKQAPHPERQSQVRDEKTKAKHAHDGDHENIVAEPRHAAVQGASKSRAAQDPRQQSSSKRRQEEQRHALDLQGQSSH